MKFVAALLSGLLAASPASAAVARGVAPRVLPVGSPRFEPSLLSVARPNLLSAVTPLLSAPSLAPRVAPAHAAAPAPAEAPALLAAPEAAGPLTRERVAAAGAARRVFAELGLAVPSDAPAAPAPRAPRELSHDFPRMFDLARRVLSRPEARKFLREAFKEDLTLTEEQQAEYGLPEKVKELSESQFVLLLQHNPRHWPLIEKYLDSAEAEDGKKKPSEAKREEHRALFRELLADERIVEVFRKFNDPLTPMRLDAADGGPGYHDARVFANHQTIADGKTKPAEDLKQVLIDFINGAEKELMFNVFDFDLMDVADALVAAAGRGVKITGGIDKNVVAERPGVKAVFDKLDATKGITMRAVDPVGLNHQKIVVRDFSDPKKAASLFSSGNFTQSCLGPEGDLDEVPAEKRPKDSVPNANHVMVVEGLLPAQVAANSLIKTLVYGLRGDEYPLGGAYRVFGAKAKGAEEAPWLVLSFSPKAGLGDANRDMTRRLILSTRGPLRLLQFAFSADSVREAIIERAKLEKAEGRALDLKSVGDAPFAVRPWSVFLALAGYELKEEGEAKEYVVAAKNALKAVLGAKAYEALRRDIRVASRVYRDHHYKPDADTPAIDYGAKLHHKVLISGGYAVLGTSFNFSEAANSNQEQYLVTSDPALVAAMYAVFDGFFALSAISLVDEVLRRNGFLKQGGEDDLKVGRQYQHVDEEAGRARRKTK